MDKEDIASEQPQRAGLKWTIEENERLMNRARKGRTITEIARKHQRTCSAIKLRIYDNAKELIDSGLHSIEEVCDMLHIQQSELEAHIAKKDKKKKSKEDEKITKTTTDHISNTHCCNNQVLYEIRDLLKLLVDAKLPHNDRQE